MLAHIDYNREEMQLGIVIKVRDSRESGLTGLREGRVRVEFDKDFYRAEFKELNF
jgi:hypothetical protein